MGHSRVSKQQSHEQIVSTAARCFRERGVDGISIANLMKEAGLTHGGFYKHFESRDDLVAEALDHALQSSSKRYAAMAPLTLDAFIDNYLSAEHRDSPGDGCAMAALVNDVGRGREDSRALYSAQFNRSLARINAMLEAESGDAAGEKAALLLSTLVGALGIARALDDEAQSNALLATVRKQLLSAVKN